MQNIWPTVQKHMPMVIVSLSAVMVIGIKGFDTTGDEVSILVQAAKWIWSHANKIAALSVLVTASALYAPWRIILSKNWHRMVTSWNWWGIGCYTIGLCLGLGAMSLGLSLSGDVVWMQVASAADMVALILIGALAAHWDPAWNKDVPPISVGAWIIGLILVVPLWLALSHLAMKI